MPIIHYYQHYKVKKKYSMALPKLTRSDKWKAIDYFIFKQFSNIFTHFYYLYFDSYTINKTHMRRKNLCLLKANLKFFILFSGVQIMVLIPTARTDSSPLNAVLLNVQVWLNWEPKTFSVTNHYLQHSGLAKVLYENG